MTSPAIKVEWIATHGYELDVVNAVLAPLGRKSELEWGCQHSCSREEIEACTALNCEAMTYLCEDDRLLLHRLVHERNWAPFAAVACRFAFTGPAPAIAALKALADASPDEARLTTTMTANARPGLARLESHGSPVAFAALHGLCGRSADLPQEVHATLPELRTRVFREVPEVAQELLDIFR